MGYSRQVGARWAHGVLAGRQRVRRRDETVSPDGGERPQSFVRAGDCDSDDPQSILADRMRGEYGERGVDTLSYLPLVHAP